MVPIDLAGKHILLTGALGAISEFIVRRLTEAGATLILTDIKSAAEARETLQGWQIAPSSYTYFSADIRASRRGREFSIREISGHGHRLGPRGGLCAASLCLCFGGGI